MIEYQASFFTGIEQISFKKGTTIDVKFLRSLYFTTDRNKVIRLVSEFESQTGSVEANYLRNRHAIVYSRSKYVLEENSDADAAHNSFLTSQILAVQTMLLDLWVIKDHAVFQDRGWLIIKKLKQNNFPPVVYNNNWMSRHSDATGSFSATDFTRDEILAALSMVNDNSHYLQDGGAPTMLASSSRRFQRFVYFVNTVRGAGDVAMKIAGYISAIESVVTASGSELTHQVAERVAFYLESKGEARLLLYKRMKTAYGLRSRVVHGSGFNIKKHQEIQETSLFLDEICRRILYKYILNEYGLSDNIEEDVDKALLELIFS